MKALRLLTSALFTTIFCLTLFSLPISAKKGEGNFSTEKLNGYLERMGADFKRASDVAGAYIMIKSENVQHADRLITLIVNVTDTEQLEILTYPEIDGKFLNVNKLTTLEGQRSFYEKLARVNYKSFGMFFVDADGDIGLRFTFSTENGLGFETFRVVTENCQRVVDRFTPTIVSFMTLEMGY